MNLKRTLSTIAMAASAMLAITACSSDATTEEPPKQSFAEGSTMARIQSEGKLVVGVKFDQPLFGLAGPDGTPVGFDIEIAKMIAHELGVPEDKIEWRETVSQNREPFIQDGQVDIVVATYTINDTRKEVIDFAGPYYVAGQSFLVPAGNPKGITSDPASLGDAKVCTVTGSTSEKNVREHTKNVITVDKYSDCLEPIRTGQADALTTDNVILAGLVSQNGEEFEVVEGTFTEEPYGIGLKKGDEEFQEFINTTLETSFEDGRWETAWKESVGDVLEMPKPPAIERY